MGLFKLVASNISLPQATHLRRNVGLTSSREDLPHLPPLCRKVLTVPSSGFDLPKFVQTAFKKLKSDVELTTDVTIGESPSIAVIISLTLVQVIIVLHCNTHNPVCQR